MSTNKQYIEVNGTSYDSRTSSKVIDILERCRLNNTRIVLDYGDTKTGKSWNEVFDITGRVRRSNGSIKIPILVYNSRSYGGGSILDYCIISIKTSLGKISLYDIRQI